MRMHFLYAYLYSYQDQNQTISSILRHVFTSKSSIRKFPGDDKSYMVKAPSLWIKKENMQL